MKRYLIPALAATICAAGALAKPANAHFLWVEPTTTGTTTGVKVFFGESNDGATTGVPLERLNSAVLRSGTTPLTATPSGGALVAQLPAGAKVASATQSFGVLDRTEGGRGVFRLEYYAKSAATLDDATQNAGLALEIFARRDGEDIVAQFKRGETPVSTAQVVVIAPGTEQERELTTNATGEVRFKAAPGLWALRGRWIDPTPGTLDGKAYPEARHYSTLLFRIAAAQPAGAAGAPATGAAPATAPDAAPAAAPQAGAPQADPQAYALLQAAHNSRQVMPENFAGFTATLVYTDGETSKTGTIAYRRQGGTTITLDGLSADDSAWVRDKLLNLIGHRRGGNFAQGDGRHPLTLGPDEHNEFGRLINLNDSMHSSYRVRDNKVTEVTRVAGGTRFTISVIETMEADPGKYLANHFIVTYRDEQTGALKMFEGYRDNYAKVDGVWLPLMRVVVEIGDAITPRIRTVRLRNIQITPAGAPVATTPVTLPATP